MLAAHEDTNLRTCGKVGYLPDLQVIKFPETSRSSQYKKKGSLQETVASSPQAGQCYG
jgi:hypothetical protein